MCGSCVSGGTAVMSDQAEKGGNFQFLGGNITGKFLEVKEDFLSKNSFDLVTLPTYLLRYLPYKSFTSTTFSAFHQFPEK
jgi:hypothetical protein